MKNSVTLMLVVCMLLFAGCHDATVDTPKETFAVDTTGPSDTLPTEQQEAATQEPTQQEQPTSTPEPPQQEETESEPDLTQPVTTPPTEQTTEPEPTETFAREDDELSGMPI